MFLVRGKIIKKKDIKQFDRMAVNRKGQKVGSIVTLYSNANSYTKKRRYKNPCHRKHSYY